MGIFKKGSFLLVVVASLGYFVDIYDLVLFNVIKKASLVEQLGLSGADLQQKEIFLFNCQMFGMMLGGLIWGILGDKKGRLSVLFGSIFLYSMANIANAFVTDLTVYALVRFLAGLGLAGELGAGVTLVVETLEKNKRGYGTMIIVTFGALGAVLASLVGASLGPKSAYLVGGGLGLMLLFLRFGTRESVMFHTVKEKENVERGNFAMLFKNRKIFVKYLSCILIGVPIWYIIGVLIALSVGIAESFGIQGVETGKAIMYAYLGLSAGDFLSGLLSQWFRSRIKVVAGYLVTSLILILLYLFPMSHNLNFFYLLCFFLGSATGYWALFVTIASEQFGTNIRSTVANTVPNFVRGSVVPLTLLYQFLNSCHFAPRWSALSVGGISIILAIWGLKNLSETFDKDLNYTES